MQSRPSPATRVVLRVTFVAAALLSVGLLAWVPMLRLAILGRARRDWVLFWCSLGVMLACVGLIGSEAENESIAWRENTAVAGLLVSAVAVTAWYLYRDIRHYEGARGLPPAAGGAFGAPPQPQPQAPYAQTYQAQAYPAQAYQDQTHPAQAYQDQTHQARAYQTHTPQTHTPQTHTPQPHTPQPHTPQPHTPQPFDHPRPFTTPPAPHPPRIDQVRAELDELSDLLRREGRDRPDGR